MLRALTVENYRGFQDKTTLELRPLTVLLGRNSSGKSSLTRLIPLIQQSLSRNSASPILWSSDAVDMGNILDVITHSGSEGELRIGLQSTTKYFDLYMNRYNYGPNLDTGIDDNDVIEYVVRLSSDGSRTRFDGIEVLIAGQMLSLDWTREGAVTSIRVDGKSYPVQEDELAVDTGSLFPEITRRRRRDASPGYRRLGLYSDALHAELAHVVHGRTASEKVAQLAQTAAFLPKRTAKEGLKRFPNVVARKVTEANAGLISDLTFINNLARILEFLRAELAPTLLSAAYIGPSRASGNRFDRIQELAVNRLDASGTNTAMYVYSLSESERNSFNDLLIKACGHTLQVDESGVGHVSIKIGKIGQTHFENITDVGFGYSQLVPVIAQLHAVRERGFGSEEAETKNVIFAVEQPELHLHPAMQANLADLFVGAIKSVTDMAETTTIIVETHSETFVAQLGILIAEQSIDPADVAVYFVDKNDVTERSLLRRVEFSPDGVINEWPTGFFSAL